MPAPLVKHVTALPQALPWRWAQGPRNVLRCVRVRPYWADPHQGSVLLDQ